MAECSEVEDSRGRNEREGSIDPAKGTSSKRSMLNAGRPESRSPRTSGNSETLVYAGGGF